MNKRPLELTIANILTLFRIFLVPAFISVLLYYSPARDGLRMVALGLFSLAVATDLCDGWVARRWHQGTSAGRILDPLADKALLVSAFICLYKISPLLPHVRLPLWLVIVALSRDVILVGGTCLIFFLTGYLRIRVSIWGKATTFFWGLTLWMVLWQWPGAMIFGWVGCFLAVVSTLDYIHQGFVVISSGGRPRSIKAFSERKERVAS